MGAMRVGKFQVLGTLGHGAHSTILHIRREEDFKPYALKVVTVDSEDDLKYVEQAEHEFEVANMFSHPNLVKVHALEKVKDWLFRLKKVHSLVEYVDGKPLDEAPAMPIPRLVRVFGKIAAALEHMHRRGVCHADLKPSNVMLGKDGEPRVIDFGLAWVRGQSKGRVQGTPEYMAPETARKKVVDERTEVYNFGASLYRMATFKLPASALPVPGARGVAQAAREGMMVPAKELNPNLPDALHELIHSCLEYKPEKRPRRMADVRESLAAVAAALGDAGPPAG